MHTIKNGFSIIELLVVVVIVSLLSAIAIPTYRSYQVKIKVTNAVPILSSLSDENVSRLITDGSFPADIELAGVTIANTASEAVNHQNIAFVHYNGAGNKTTSYICVDLSADTGIPNLKVGTGNTGVNNRLCMRTNIINHKAYKICGTWSASNGYNANIPVEYLPSNCNCTSVGSSSDKTTCTAP